MKQYLLFIAPLINMWACSAKKNSLTEVVHLVSYPSASGIEFLQEKYYVIGDDAKQILLLDNKIKVRDSILLYTHPEKRIPKAIKEDLEAITSLPDSNLLIIGSGSAPQRKKAWVLNPFTQEKVSYRLDSFFNRLEFYGVKEVNIEGAAFIPGYIVLANRGNKGYPKNQLIFTKTNFWLNQTTSEIHTMLTSPGIDSSFFNGVSGLAYAPKNDALVMTVSTEDTRNTIDDGAIGKSYIWIIKNISSKRKWKAANPDIIIDLNKTDQRFEGQKIESVCVIAETAKELTFVLVADNDDGASTVFKLTISKD